jgi:hypothetical protein
VGGTGAWTTGVTMADVNGDGFQDLYVSGVSYLDMHGRNVLYINDGNGHFTDRTREYGLDFAGYSTQAVFFDYDGDGDLDMYLLNYSTHGERQSAGRGGSLARNPRAGDRLYRNDGGHFVDVSDAAGIEGGLDGFGLGVVASDVNMDGCPDLYVSNDFQENDYLYLNRCDGTFTESIATATGHTSRFSMGVDAADFNNDGRPDLITVDMLPRREEILKTSANTESFDLFMQRVKSGYHPQYARNTLQLNRGSSRFSEIGYLAGVSATDWSWSALFADLDNDGLKDLFITSGIYRRANDLDYIALVGSEASQAILAKGNTAKNASLLETMPHVPQPNSVFRNDGNLTFTDMSKAWGVAQPGFSNGAVYVDLNNSGALDLVVNNVNAPASIYRNRARTLGARHYLTVRLRGAGKNTDGIGAKVFVTTGNTRQLVEASPTRGFQSSVDSRLHFGLGAATRVDTLVVVWPDRAFQTLTDVVLDRMLTLSRSDASGTFRYPPPAAEPLFTDVSARLGADVTHEEDSYSDFAREPLIPHLLSAEGPALAVGDVNGDGLDDMYLGGAKWQPGRLLVQQRDGRFVARPQPSIAADSIAEDVDAAFLDANGDGHPDLLVVSGGNEFWGQADALRSRLYLNDGAGNFRRDTTALPPIFENGSCVATADFDGDGHVDLFIGSRVVGRRYGETPTSHLLHNDGTGHFTDVTLERAPALSRAGMVTSATWTDYDGDGKLDLVVAGEWMPVRIFRQVAGGRFEEKTADAGFARSSGWWNSVTVLPAAGRAKPDLLLGNLGLNSYLRASSAEPARLYVGDFAHDGGLQQILTFYKDGVSYPMATRDELLGAIPSLRERFTTYKSFGASRVEDILPTPELRSAIVLQAYDFASTLARNRGDGSFALSALPVEAQLAPINAAVSDDFDGDGYADLLVAGNAFGVAPVLGRYDASYGLLLRGTRDGRYAPVDMDADRLAIDGVVRHLKLLRGADGARLIAVARNDDRLALLRVRGSGARVARARESVANGTPTSIGGPHAR